jgi:hypothetical protein
MPTKLRALDRRRKGSTGLVSDRAVELYREGRRLMEEGDIETWEEDGGDRRAMLDCCVDLMRELGRKVWQEDVFFIDDPGPPPWFNNDIAKHDWREGWALRCELERAIAEETK